MIPYVANALRATFSIAAKCDVTIMSHFTVGTIIPDLIAGVWHGSTPVHPMPRVSYVEAAVLSVVQARGTMTVRDLNEHLNLTESGAHRALTSLEHKGAIHHLDDSLVAVENNSLCNLRILAFELKMSRWRDALRQAGRYREFAHQSYVVLDATQTRPTLQMLNAFDAAGVGLLLQYGGFSDQAVPAAQACPASAATIQVSRALATRAAIDQRELHSRERAPLLENLEPYALVE